LALFEFILLFIIFLNITGKDLKPSLLRKHTRTFTSDPSVKVNFIRVNLECICYIYPYPGDTVKTGIGKVDPAPGYCLKNFVNLFFLNSEKFDVKTIMISFYCCFDWIIIYCIHYKSFNAPRRPFFMEFGKLGPGLDLKTGEQIILIKLKRVLLNIIGVYEKYKI